MDDDFLLLCDAANVGRWQAVDRHHSRRAAAEAWSNVLQPTWAYAAITNSGPQEWQLLDQSAPISSDRNWGAKLPPHSALEDFILDWTDKLSGKRS